MMDECEPWRKWLEEQKNKRCENCAWWDAGKGILQEHCLSFENYQDIPENFQSPNGLCWHFKEMGHNAYIWADISDGLEISPNFYCSEWKKKEEKE